jgi:hypothetical protein
MSSSNVAPSHAVHVKPVYSIPEFCRDFGVGRSSAYVEIREKRLRAFKIGAAARIAGEDALAWRESHRSPRAA